MNDGIFASELCSRLFEDEVAEFLINTAGRINACKNK